MIFNFGLLFSASGPAAGQLTALGNKINQIGAGLQKVGGIMTAAFTLPFIAGTTIAANTSGKFEKEVLKLNRRLRETPEVIKQLEDAALKLTEKGILPVNSIQLLQQMAFEGMNATQMLTHMTELVDYATNTETEMNAVTGQLCDIIDSFGLSSDNTSEILSTLAYTAETTGQKTQELVDSFLGLKMISKDLGWSLNSVSAAYNILGQAGFKGSQAGKSFFTIVQKLIDISPAAIKVFKSVGIKKSDLYDSNNQLRDLGHVLDVIKGKHLNTAQLADVFGKNALAAKTLIQAGSAGLGENTAKGHEDINKKGADAVRKGFIYGVEQLKAALDKLMITIGNSGLLEFFTKGVNKITAFIEKLTTTNPALIKVGLIIGSIVAIAGPLIAIIGTLIVSFFAISTAVAAVGWPVIGIIAGIVAAIIGLVAVFTNFASNTKNVLTKYFVLSLGPISWVIGWIMTRWSRLLPYFKLIAYGIGEAFKFIIPIAKTVMAFLSPILDAIFWLFDKVLGLMDKITKWVLPKDLQEKFGFIQKSENRSIFEINNPKQKIEQTTTINLTGMPPGMGAYSLDPNTYLRGAQ